MSIEEVDEEIPKGKSKDSSGQQANNSESKDKLDGGSPPRSPGGKEKCDDEKDVVLDIPTCEVPLRDSPSSSPLPPLPPEDFATCRRRMLTRVLSLLFAQWFIASLASILAAVAFRTRRGFGYLHIVLTALVAVGVLSHVGFVAVVRIIGKMKNAPFAIPGLVVNLGHLGFVSLVLIVAVADLTFIFSEFWFNIIALSVVLSLAVHLVVIFRLKRVPRIRCVLNGCLASSLIAAFVFGLTVCYERYETEWRGVYFVGLLITWILGTLLSGSLIIKAIILTEDKAVVNGIKVDFGAAAVIEIYRSGLDKLWSITVGEELLDRGA